MDLKTLFFLFAAVAAGTAPTQAHPLLCNTRESLIDKLQNRYSENLVGIGLASSGSVFELMVSDEFGTWTLLYTTPDGIGCVVATGEVWSQVVKKLDGEGT
jgi:hypothetical protein